MTARHVRAQAAGIAALGVTVVALVAAWAGSPWWLGLLCVAMLLCLLLAAVERG